MSNDSKSRSTGQSKGDFYVEERCCTSCGVPQSIAPELVGWKKVDELESCQWIRQPETPAETDRAIKILHTQELDCHRYAGKDPKILKRLPPLVATKCIQKRPSDTHLRLVPPMCL